MKWKLQTLLTAVDEMQATAGLAEAINPILTFDVERLRKEVDAVLSELRQWHAGFTRDRYFPLEVRRRVIELLEDTEETIRASDVGDIDFQHTCNSENEKVPGYAKQPCLACKMRQKEENQK